MTDDALTSAAFDSELSRLVDSYLRP
jgi:hypothetical protein